MITLFPSRCYNGGKQHRFQPRVTENIVPPKLGEFHGNGYVAVDLIKAGLGTQVLEVYHGDVCCWCGAVVNQPSSTPKESSP